MIVTPLFSGYQENAFNYINEPFFFRVSDVNGPLRVRLGYDRGNGYTTVEKLVRFVDDFTIIDVSEIVRLEIVNDRLIVDNLGFGDQVNVRLPNINILFDDNSGTLLKSMFYIWGCRPYTDIAEYPTMPNSLITPTEYELYNATPVEANGWFTITTTINYPGVGVELTTITNDCEYPAFIVFKSRYGGMVTFPFKKAEKNITRNYRGNEGNGTVTYDYEYNSSLNPEYTKLDYTTRYTLTSINLEEKLLQVIDGINYADKIWLSLADNKQRFIPVDLTSASTTYSNLSKGGRATLTVKLPNVESRRVL